MEAAILEVDVSVEVAPSMFEHSNNYIDGLSKGGATRGFYFFLRGEVVCYLDHCHIMQIHFLHNYLLVQ